MLQTVYMSIITAILSMFTQKHISCVQVHQHLCSQDLCCCQNATWHLRISHNMPIHEKKIKILAAEITTLATVHSLPIVPQDYVNSLNRATILITSFNPDIAGA